MSLLNQFRLFAAYNRLMNQRLYEAASQLSAEELKEDRGAFFKSVIGTLNHILVGDILWLKRFSQQPSSARALSYLAGLEKPTALDAILFDDLETLREERAKIDDIIMQWINALSENDMKDCVAYKNMAGIDFNKPFISLISHLFLHQVHHRGQVTTLLSQCGLDFGDTDLIEIIDECQEPSPTFGP